MLRLQRRPASPASPALPQPLPLLRTIRLDARRRCRRNQYRPPIRRMASRKLVREASTPPPPPHRPRRTEACHRHQRSPDILHSEPMHNTASNKLNSAQLAPRSHSISRTPLRTRTRTLQWPQQAPPSNIRITPIDNGQMWKPHDPLTRCRLRTRTRPDRQRQSSHRRPRKWQIPTPVHLRRSTPPQYIIPGLSLNDRKQLEMRNARNGSEKKKRHTRRKSG
jgi:hypothetical protein